LGHLATRLVHCLLHGDRDFAGLALAHADATVTVADHGQRGEAENPAALHHLGDTVDGDHLFAHAVVTFFGLLRFSALRFSHFLLRSFPAAQNLSPLSRAASASALIRP